VQAEVVLANSRVLLSYAIGERQYLALASRVRVHSPKVVPTQEDDLAVLVCDYVD